MSCVIKYFRTFEFGRADECGEFVMLLTEPEAKKELLELEPVMEVEAKAGGAMRGRVMVFKWW